MTWTIPKIYHFEIGPLKMMTQENAALTAKHFSKIGPDDVTRRQPFRHAPQYEGTCWPTPEIGPAVRLSRYLDIYLQDKLCIYMSRLTRVGILVVRKPRLKSARIVLSLAPVSIEVWSRFSVAGLVLCEVRQWPCCSISFPCKLGGILSWFYLIFKAISHLVRFGSRQQIVDSSLILTIALAGSSPSQRGTESHRRRS